jgi:hypothetical protein
MLATVLTEHGRSRVIRRAIAEDVIDCVLSFSIPKRRHKADVYMLKASDKAEIFDELGAKKYRKIERKLRTYIVVADTGKIITAAYRNRRFRFH